MMEKELPLPPKKKKTTKDASSSSSPPRKEDSTSHSIPPTTGEARANLFPQFLMKLLNDEVAPDSLWWLPDGLAFGIDPIKITGDVLDHHFQKTKYSSFIRRLHNEGFRRQTRKYKKMDHLQLPEGTVVLSHELFQKDHPELLEKFYQRSPATLATTTTTAAGSSGSSNPKNASQFHQAMLAAAAAGNNSANLALVQEAKARMEARNHHALLSSVPPKTTTGDDLAAAASVWGLQGAGGSATAGGRTHPSLDALSMTGRFGSAGMAPNLQIPFDTTTTNTATGGRLSLEELRQVRLQRELLAQQQQQQQLLKSYQTGGLLGPSATTTSGLSHHPYLHSGLRMNNIQPMSRSSSTESAQQKQQQQQQQQQQQHQLDLMIQQQMLSGGVSFPSLGGSAAATAGFGTAATNTGMDAQVNHLRQLELETRRRRLQLEQQQHHQQQQQQQFQRQDQQQKLSAADTLRRFTNNTSPSF